MANRKIPVEFKHRRLTRPMLDQIVGAQLRLTPDASEIIIRCLSATKTVYEELDSYTVKITIIAREATPQDS